MGCATAQYKPSALTSSIHEKPTCTDPSRACLSEKLNYWEALQDDCIGQIGATGVLTFYTEGLPDCEPISISFSEVIQEIRAAGMEFCNTETDWEIC